MSRKTLKGFIVSVKSPKTLVVRVSHLREHPKYKKYIKVSKRYKAHYDHGEYAPGDIVTIQESPPISRDKRWRVVEKATGQQISKDIASEAS